MIDRDADSLRKKLDHFNKKIILPNKPSLKRSSLFHESDIAVF